MANNQTLKEIKRHLSSGCFALHYDWEAREIKPLATEDEYFQEIMALKDIGVTRRCECYRSQPLAANRRQRPQHLYMVSFGDYRRGKFIHGENPIAAALGKCLFDYVFVFPETAEFAREKCLFRIKENLQINLVRTRLNAKLLINCYRRLFGECKELKRLEKVARNMTPRDDDDPEA